MKHLKMLGLAVLAVGAFMAIGGSASATPIITSPAGTEFTGEVHETLSGSWIIKPGFTTVTCTEVTRIWDVTTNTSTAAGGPYTKTTYSGCGSASVVVLKSGSREVASGGSVKGSGTEVTFSAGGTSCVYGTGTGTTVGKLNNGSPATMTESGSLPKISGGFLCASTASVSGSYIITFPNTFIID
jgi:hypothetical protein